MKQTWSQRELQQASRILAPHPHDLHISHTVFWSSLVVVIFANILAAFILVPFLIVLSNIALYSIIIILGGIIGLLYNHLLKDISHLETKHHILASIILPSIAIINIVTVVLISNQMITDLQVQNTVHSPWIAAIVFTAAFLLPTVVRLIRSKI